MLASIRNEIKLVGTVIGPNTAVSTSSPSTLMIYFLASTQRPVVEYTLIYASKASGVSLFSITSVVAAKEFVHDNPHFKSTFCLFHGALFLNVVIGKTYSFRFLIFNVPIVVCKPCAVRARFKPFLWHDFFNGKTT